MTKKLLLIGLLVFLLTGCVKGDVNIEYVDENTANFSIKVLFQEEVLNSADTSITDLQHKLTNSELSNWQNKQIIDTINGVDYVGFELTAPKDINESLLKLFTNDKKEDTYQVTIDKSIINDIFNTSEIEDINNYSLSSLKSMGLELNLNITMPGKITKTNYGKFKNNQASINLLEFLSQEETKTITINSSDQTSNFRPLNIIIFIGLVLILFIILRKRQ